MADVMTLGQAAKHFGVETWHVQKLAAAGKLGPLKRAGIFRIVGIADLPRIKKALEEAGYLKK